MGSERRPRECGKPVSEAPGSSRRRRGADARPSWRSALGRIDAGDGRIRAFLEVTGELALAEARAVDARVAAGERLPLAGVPLAVKDNIWMAGRQATCASRILAGFRPPGDSTVAARLREAGAVFIGRANMDEFAMGSSTENSSSHVTRNPWDPERIPGGSSGGSAAAVAARFVPGGFGSDTGGSIRQPAACCGVVGFKPTYGRVSRYGLVAFASSLDQIGPLTRSVADAARLYRVDRRRRSARLDDGAPRRSATPRRRSRAECAGMRVGFLAEAGVRGARSRGRREPRGRPAHLPGRGRRGRSVSVPRATVAIAIYYVVASAEASSNLARFDGVRYGPRATDEDLAALYVESRTAGFGAGGQAAHPARHVRARVRATTRPTTAGRCGRGSCSARRLRARVRARST